jgi:hypothetical protein
MDLARVSAGTPSEWISRRNPRCNGPLIGPNVNRQWAIVGHYDQSKEKNGALHLLSNDRQTVLATIRFYNRGIVRIAPEKWEANADQIKRVQVELYVERMEFEYAAQVKG